MKKVSLLALVAAFTAPSIASANVPANCPKAFQGFFLGGNVGMGVGTGSQLVSYSAVQQGGGPVFPQASSKNRLGFKGFDGGLNTGYNYRTNNVVLGLEFVANWTNSKGNVSFYQDIQPRPLASSSAKLNNSLQLRGNISYVIANLVAPKFIIGWDSSRFITNTTLIGAGTFNAVGTPVPFRAERSKYLNGFLIGGGVDFLATKHFIIGMDATISMFGKTSVSRTFVNPAPVGFNINQTGSFKPSPYTKISLNAKFIY